MTRFYKYFSAMLPTDLGERVERSKRYLLDKYHSIASIWDKICDSPGHTLTFERFTWAWY